MKNGVVVYADPSFGYGKAKDVYGHQASARWNPRICISGHAYVRRFYSDRRVKGPMIRKGFKAWVDAGFPRDPKRGSLRPSTSRGAARKSLSGFRWKRPSPT